ncbi:hypothetical protein [Nocardia sp. R7R-8]
MVHATILSIATGQWAAAQALGMSYPPVATHLRLRRALRVAAPYYG